MERHEYLQELRRYEVEARSQPEQYRRKVLAFAWLGHGVPLLAIALGLGLIGLGLYWLLAGIWLLLTPILLGSGGLLLWTVWKSPAREPAEEAGFEVSPEDAPELFRLLDKIRRRLQGPALHKVIITTDYNATISQYRSHGLLGRAHNTLAIGLPLLMTLDRNRLTAVLAHEYAHLRSGNGSLSALLYRDRAAWHRLSEPEANGLALTNPAARLASLWLNWYAPRLLARSFALARQEEFTADRMAGEQVGMDIHAGALLEVHLRQTQMTHRLWSAFWAQARETPEPATRPWAWAVEGRLPQPSRLDLQSAMVDIRTEPAHHDDTHPTTRDRVTSLGGEVRFPGLSREGSLRLLGEAALQRVVLTFDERWWQRNRDDWTHAHERAQRDVAAMKDMASRVDELDRPTLGRLAKLTTRLGSPQDSIPVFEEMLRRDPSDAEATWQMLKVAAERQDLTALSRLSVLAKTHPDRALSCAKLALSLLEKGKSPEGQVPDEPDDIRRHWQTRLEEAEQKERAAATETTPERVLDRVLPHDLDDHEVEELIEAASHIPQVKALHVLRRPLRTFPNRRCFIVVVTFRVSRVLPPLSPEAVLARLSLQVPAWAVDHDDVDPPPPGARALPLGQPVYLRAKAGAGVGAAAANGASSVPPPSIQPSDSH